MTIEDAVLAVTPLSTFEERFPGLRPLSSWRLSGPEVAPVIRDQDERLELSWLEKHDVHTVGDLLQTSPDDMTMWRGFGAGKIDRLIAFTQRLDVAATGLLWDQIPKELPPPEPRGTSLVVADTAHDLTSLVEWARFSAGAATVRDLVRSLSANDGPDDVIGMAGGLLETRLPAVDLDPLGDLQAWVATLDERNRAILQRRFIGFEEATLDEIGAEFGLTRERIRQLEVKLRGQVHDWVGSDDGRSVRWASHLLSRGLGACAPDSEVPLVGEDGGHSDGFGLLLFLVNMVWDRDRHVVRRRDFAWPGARDLPLVDGGPVVEEVGLRTLLHDRGVVEPHIDWAVGQVPGLRRFAGTLVVWPRNMVDQGIAVLTVTGAPLSHEEIAELIGRDINVRGLRNRLMDDPRVRRVTKNDFALSSWGLPEYGGIVASMVQRLEDQGPSTVPDLAAYLNERHSINVRSVSAYSLAPIFIRDGDLIRLRRADEPYAPSLDLASVEGLFRLGSRRFAWHVPADRDLLRGSGRFFPAEVATALGVYPGRSENLANPVRDMTITWTATTHMGPSISSLRHHAEDLEAVMGSRLRIIIDAGARTAEVFLVPERMDSVEAVAALLDVAPDKVSVERLGRALDVAPEAVEEALRRRGDEDIANLIATGLVSGVT